MKKFILPIIRIECGDFPYGIHCADRRLNQWENFKIVKQDDT